MPMALPLGQLSKSELLPLLLPNLLLLKPLLPSLLPLRLLLTVSEQAPLVSEQAPLVSEQAPLLPPPLLPPPLLPLLPPLPVRVRCGSGSGRHAAKSEATGIYPHAPKIATLRCGGTSVNCASRTGSAAIAASRAQGPIGPRVP